MVKIWNTGLAAERARFNLKLKKNKKIKKKVRAQARKRSSAGRVGPQASKLTSKNFFWPTIATRRDA